jgi:hypothetical protein
MTSIVIDKDVILMDDEGRSRLNDLHRLAGGEGQHQPSNFLRLDTTQGLIREIHSSDLRSAPVEVINGGPDRGTYVCRVLVYAYAMWISPVFHLKVIRAFDAMATGHVLPQPTTAAPQLPGGPLQDKVAAHFAIMECMRCIPGVNAGIAGAVVLEAIHVDTGLTMEPYRKLLPAAEGPTATMNATAVGRAQGLSAQKVNKVLEALGLQRRKARGGWEITEAGAQYGEMRPFSKNGHADFQPLWKPAVLDLLRKPAGQALSTGEVA